MVVGGCGGQVGGPCCLLLVLVLALQTLATLMLLVDVLPELRQRLLQPVHSLLL